MKTPILGSSYVARSVNAADSRMVNLFPEVVLEGGKEPAFLQRCAGLRFVAEVGGGPIRGLWKFGDYLYVASGGELYRVDGNYNTSFLGYIDGSGPVSMVDNGEQLFIACNPSAFIYNANTGVFGQITDPDFPGAVTVGYLDGYFVFNQPNSQRFWVTSLNDGTQIDPLDFASAEGNPDDVVALNVNHREVWLFGTSTVEVWYNAGLADFPLARIAGAFMEVGCAAPYSVAKLDNSVFWLGSDIRGNGIVYRNNGYNAQRISTHAIEWQIQQYDVINDAIGYSYQQDGHLFYILTFPTGTPFRRELLLLITESSTKSIPLVIRFRVDSGKGRVPVRNPACLVKRSLQVRKSAHLERVNGLTQAGATQTLRERLVHAEPCTLRSSTNLGCTALLSDNCIKSTM